MTSADPAWLQGSGVRPYVLADAEVALRLLLPPRTARDDPTTWAAVAASVEHPEPIDASTSWARLTELDGRGAEQPAPFEHPEGRPSGPLLEELTSALMQVADPQVSWHYQENSDCIGTQVELVPADDQGSGRATAYAPAALVGSIAELAKQWASHGFHGRAWDDAATIGLAADSYADSIILSGPARLASILAKTNLEIFRLATSATNPMTTN